MEFLEETGVDLNAYPPIQVDCANWSDKPYTYYGVYFRVAATDLTQIYNQVTISMNNSRTLATVIQQIGSPIVRPIDVASYANGHNMTLYAYDNELNNIEKWCCKNQGVINRISGWNNKAQSWFIPIFNHLRTLC